jgi:peptide subunit release factor 1 (eRF1)
VPFEERFVVDEYPDLGPLAALLDEQAPALVVFVDGETARLIPVTATGGDEEVRLAGDVPGHHRRGGWAQLAQSRYARHIETHRARHFDAVARAVTAVVDARRVRQIVLAGHEDQVSAFRDHLPDRLQRLVVAAIHAARWETACAIGQRGAERLALEERSDEVEDVDDLLTAAAKGDRAVAGPGTLAAAGRGAIHRLYILAGFRRQGRQCEQCGTLAEIGATCPRCGDPTRDTELGAALVDRVLRTGGSVEMIAQHAGLAAAGGVAARLRYSMRKDGT